METRVQKWGNSLAVRIPKPLASELGLENNSPVDLSLVSGKLVIVPAVKLGLSLEALLAQVTEDNLHGEFDAGSAVGGEAW